MLLSAAVAASQTAPPPESPFVAELNAVLARSAAGHSPTAAELHAAENSAGLTDATTARTLAPLLYKALTSQDAMIRQYALAMLLGLQVLPEPAAAPPAAVPPEQPAKNEAAPSASFKAGVATQFAPLVPAIAARLADDNPDTRSLAALALGGFAPAPPPTIYPPLFAFLWRDDAIGSAGLGVTLDLEQFSPMTRATADAIAGYLERSDQTTASRIELVEGLAQARMQNATVNQALLGYLDADDAALRTRLILSLPQLELDAGVFEQTRARIADLAASGQDNAEVVAAAKAITTCWTQPRPARACPAN